MPQADLLLAAERVISMDPVLDGIERERTLTAVAVLDGRVLWVGRREDAAWCRGPDTKVLDFGRATIVPGLIDAHLHTVSFGLALAQVDVRPAACPGIA
ncbi:MAG: hypothetical protein Q8P31_03935, partial [Bacillota bacterium]|nr:hypothetical protein [Bacillota bacterium]